MFNFDYKDDLMVMARERERVFSLSRFTTMAEEEAQEESSANVFSRIYGPGGGADKKPFGGVELNEINLEDDTEYIDPRTSYPEQAGIVGFDKVQRPVMVNADKYDMDFA